MPASLAHFVKVRAEAETATDEELLDWIRKTRGGKRSVRSDTAWTFLLRRGWTTKDVLDATM